MAKACAYLCHRCLLRHWWPRWIRWIRWKKRSAERIDIKTYVDLDLGDLSMHVKFKFEIFHELWCHGGQVSRFPLTLHVGLPTVQRYRADCDVQNVSSYCVHILRMILWYSVAFAFSSECVSAGNAELRPIVSN